MERAGSRRTICTGDAMIKQYEIEVAGATLTCDVDEYEYTVDQWHEHKITTSDNIIVKVAVPNPIQIVFKVDCKISGSVKRCQ